MMGKGRSQSKKGEDPEIIGTRIETQFENLVERLIQTHIRADLTVEETDRSASILMLLKQISMFLNAVRIPHYC